MSAPEKDAAGLHPSVDKFLNWLRKRFAVSIVIVGVLFIGAASKLVDEIAKLYEIFRPTPRPALSISFVDQRRPRSELTVNPSWHSLAGIGFSNPVHLTIALQNMGSAAATNIEVYLLYPPGVLTVSKSTGAKTVPAVLGDVIPITGYETTEQFNIARIDPSPIANIFEREMQVQFRFREVFGLPIIRDSVPMMMTLNMDFANAAAAHLGDFPITYVVKFSEADRPATGTIILRLSDESRKLLPSRRFDTDLGLVSRNSPPSLGPGTRTKSVEVDFLSDGMQGLAQLASATCGNADQKTIHPKTIKATAYEEQTESEVWSHFVLADGEELIFLDRGNDGILDREFLKLTGVEWFEMAPKTPAPYIPLSKIIDTSGRACLAARIGEGLGIRH